jgi:hypothetical protein
VLCSICFILPGGFAHGHCSVAQLEQTEKLGVTRLRRQGGISIVGLKGSSGACGDWLKKKSVWDGVGINTPSAKRQLINEFSVDTLLNDIFVS